MTRYYGFHSSICDATRWMFLFGRTQIIRDLSIQPNETVLEVGCGTGRNFGPIQARLGVKGRLIGVDCSAPMLARAEQRIHRFGWRNANIVDSEYGRKPGARGETDVVIMSYSLSMMPDWQQVLRCAKSELEPGGRIGIVDFLAADRRHQAANRFADWMRWNHVEMDRPYENVLVSMFEPALFISRPACGGLWTFFRYTGGARSCP